ncbi:MAG: hypothetical protein CSA49_01055 [Gammaproteobacteria bacterium]|nr:MAG: hypothetical protein CSA49_01055 [Gammaproteobacteria bacterium]
MFDQVYLASASPRRRELLQQIGVKHKVYPVDLDESWNSGESPEEYVCRLAAAKAAAGWNLINAQHKTACPVMGADTSVVFDGHILGKPQGKQHALAMLRTLSGASHRVMSAVAMQFADRVECRLSCTDVVFRSLTEDLLERYWQSGEPADKAGAYGIQGFGAAFVKRIEGSYSGVVGLPLAETIALLEHFNVSYWAAR